MISQKLFHDLYDKWKENGFNINDRPSVDRIDDEIGYCFRNIQLTTWAFNRDKNLKKIKNKKIIEIIQVDIHGVNVCIFESASDASRVTGTSRSHINEVCNGKRKTANGYIWKFKNAS